MINEFSVHPKPQNNNAKIIFGVCLIIAFAFILASSFFTLYKGVIAFAGVCFIITALIFYTKYMAVEFIYDVMIVDGIPLLVVRQITGKRQSTLCRVELADVTDVTTESREVRRAHKTPVGVRKYNYTPTVSPAEVHRLTVSNKYERAEIVLEGSREFADNLRAIVIEAKEIRLSLQDDDDE